MVFLQELALVITLICPQATQVRDYIRDVVVNAEGTLLTRLNELRENSQGRDLAASPGQVDAAIPMQVDAAIPMQVDNEETSSDNELVSLSDFEAKWRCFNMIEVESVLNT